MSKLSGQAQDNLKRNSDPEVILLDHVNKEAFEILFKEFDLLRNAVSQFHVTIDVSSHSPVAEQLM